MIHVVGQRRADYAAPNRKHEPDRALSKSEVRRLRQELRNLQDVGWRPFGEALAGWNEAARWAEAILDEALERAVTG